MKNKEQILEHLLEVGYTNKAIYQICAYLLGAGVKKRAEILKIRKGDAVFDDFLRWIEGLRFKAGDCVYLQEDTIGYCLMSSADTVTLYSLNGLFWDANIKVETRLATNEERSEFDATLARNGFYFDKETLTVKPLH